MAPSTLTTGAISENKLPDSALRRAPSAPEGAGQRGTRPPERVPAMRYLPHGDLLRVLATLAVILLHVACYGVFHYRTTTPLNWWVCNAMDALGRWAVPIFVLLSGALLLDPAHPEPAASFYRKRLARVGVPFAFWTLFYLLWDAFFNGRGWSSIGALHALLSGAPYYHLHFVSIILGLYLFTPALRLLVRHAERGTLWGFVIAAFILSIGDTLIRTDQGSALNLFTRFAPFVGYYCAGYLLRDCTLPPRGLVLAALALVAATALTVGIAGWSIGRGEGKGLVVYDPLSPTSIVMSICIFLMAGSLAARRGSRLQRRSGLLRRLADATLGVYLIHPALIDLLHARGFTAVSPNLWLGTFGGLTLVATASFVLVSCLQRLPGLRHLV